MKTIALAPAIFTLGVVTGTVIAQQPPATTQRIPQFENDQVKAWKSIIMPKQPLTLHRHEHGRAIVVLKGGTLNVVQQSGSTKALAWETGKAYWLDADPPGTQHGDVNDGSDPIEVNVVEQKK
jgi:quercetin dioxygenase-like cupin family protein